ncbi:MAG: 16S rRNA (cytidine(1402)-2'-O)-methyltransferase [Dethiobacteria bacterium]
MSEKARGTLYVCPTPIGNLGDITLRALACLRDVQLILAEDTRHTKKILEHYDLHTPLLSYHKYNRAAREHEIIRRLQQGEDVALVSNAGAPAVSDPGAELVRSARENNITVVPLPGASAVLTAFIAAGMPGDRFVFWGFLDRRPAQREKELKLVAREEKPSIIFEAPHRLQQLLEELCRHLGEERQVVIARELTKKYEEIKSAPLKEHLRYYQEHEPKGELTLVVSGAVIEREQLAQQEVVKKVAALVEAGLSDKDAVKALSVLENCSRREIYNLWMGEKTECIKRNLNY